MLNRLSNRYGITVLVISAIAFAYPSYSNAQLDQAINAPLKLSARYHIQTGTNTGFLIVKVDLPDGNYIYSLTQKEPLNPSKLSVKKSKLFVTDKKFKTDKKPKVTENDPLFNARLEKHSGTVQFYVPLKITNQADPKQIKPEVLFSGQVCSEVGFCVPIHDLKVTAEFAGYFEREAKNTIPPLKQKK